MWPARSASVADDSTMPDRGEGRIAARRILRFPGGINLTLDSSDPNTKIDNPELTFLGDVFKLESEIAYTVVLDDQNKVKAIEGTEKLLEKAEKLADPIARDEFASQLGPTGSRQSSSKRSATCRTSWPAPASPGSGPRSSKSTATRRSRSEEVRVRGTEKKGDKTLDKISCKVLEVKYDQDPKGKSPLKVVKSDLKVESSEGTILFDREEGHVVSSSDKIRIKGNMTFSGAAWINPVRST